MATARLVPSTYYVNNSQYVSVSNDDRMYTNTDSTTYGTFTHNRASTNNTYYAYLRGFNFNDIPSNAVVSSFTIKIKASATGHTTSTSSSYYMSLYNGTAAIGSTSASGRLSTTLTTFTFNIPSSLTWDVLKGYGANFGIRIPLRRANQNTADVVSVYGAEIEVTYTVPNPRTITSTLTGNGTIDPSGTHTYYDGDEYELTIEPTNENDTVTVTHNGVDVTSQLVAHTSGNDDRVLGTYTLVSGTFNSGSDWFSGRVGKGHDTTDTTTTNYYSSSNNTIVVFTYDVGFTIPSNATITRVYALVNGHAESTSQSSEYMCAKLISGNTDLSAELNFKSVGTSNSTQTVEATTLPTVSQLASMKLQCRLGYYGGAINGATVYVEYTLNGKFYTYSFTVGSDATIAVTIGGSGSQPKLFVKKNGSWVEVATAYKKVNGSWVVQSDKTTVFQNGVNYLKGN